MFVGALNQTVRGFLGNVAEDAFAGARVVVGCSGNFTSEAVLAQHGHPAEVHSNDVSFYSCLVGAWLTSTPFDFEIVEDGYKWLSAFTSTPLESVSAFMTLLEMLKYDKRNNTHARRMWDIHRDQFGDMVARTVQKIAAEVNISIASYYAGDVFDHFKRFESDPYAIYCCYAPTYAGGYERLYSRVEAIVRWAKPEYTMLDDERRNELIQWMAARRYVWYDDRLIPGMEPVMLVQAGRSRTVYLYSNVIAKPAVFYDQIAPGLPPLPLADASLHVTPTSRVEVQRIKTTDLFRFKQAFLGKSVNPGSGSWAFAVYVDGKVVGFFEFTGSRYGIHDELYMMADFPVPHTPYARLSKLVVMLALSGETRRKMEHITVERLRTVTTTAFTDRPVSMKYRGVMELAKRGVDAEGKPFLNYVAGFSSATWQETLSEWIAKHSTRS